MIYLGYRLRTRFVKLQSGSYLSKTSIGTGPIPWITDSLTLNVVFFFRCCRTGWLIQTFESITSPYLTVLCLRATTRHLNRLTMPFAR